MNYIFKERECNSGKILTYKCMWKAFKSLFYYSYNCSEAWIFFLKEKSLKWKKERCRSVYNTLSFGRNAHTTSRRKQKKLIPVVASRKGNCSEGWDKKEICYIVYLTMLHYWNEKICIFFILCTYPLYRTREKNKLF